MKLQAAVPAGAPPNALLRVRLPDGNEVNVRVPEGLEPGDEFIFEVSSMGDPIAPPPPAATAAGGGGAIGGGGAGAANAAGGGTGWGQRVNICI